MTNMTLAIPEELHNLMKEHSDIKWSEVARKALWEHAKRQEQLKLMDRLLAKSKLTEKDALRTGREVNAAIARRHGLNA
ncbi:hypothetical protein HYV84_04260 [Candidatus Woesearchaeota archaeon]|nr:hypothetical protein [Candidatus Woesearchaeota archaeon]